MVSRFLSVILALPALMAIPLVAVADPVLKVPNGFSITKVAGQPLVRFPVLGDFDDKGRLYVIDMAGPITHAEVAAKKAVHKIVRLEDTNNDGTFDQAITFADALPFPEGCMFFNGSIYSACPPQILKLTDTDGDGKADKREVWFDGKTLTGCANDMHGPFKGPDGYIYWTKGAFAKQEVTLGNGKKFTTRASHVFRAKPDGSGLEVMMTGGMDNPVGMAFLANGDMIVSNTFLQHPADGKRDGLIHAVPGGVWGKDHDPIYEHPWTSPRTMPIMTHMGPAAPTGLCRYTGRQFPIEYRNNLFCAQFNLRKVSRHIVMPKGSSYRTDDSDFVSSDDPDFHPTDVIQAPDGSLIVIDTGGWYKLCCPSSQLVKADVWGAIYRVTTTPRASGEPIVANVTVQFDGHSKVRRWAEGATIVDLPKLLTTTTASDDVHLDHALTYALIRLGNYSETAVGLTNHNSQIQRRTLAALEAIDRTRLKSSDVLPHLSAKDVALRETAWWIAGKHPEWGNELVGYFRKQLAAKPTLAEAEELTNQLAKFAKNEAVQQLLAEMASEPIALKAMARANLKTVPDSWTNALLTTVKLDRADVLATLRALPWKTVPQPVATSVAVVASDAQQPTAIRLSALSLVPRAASAGKNFEFLLAQLAADKPPADRALAADVLARSPFTAAQLRELAKRLSSVSPVEVPKLLNAFVTTAHEPAGLDLLAALNNPKLRAAVRAEQLKPIFEKYPPSVKAEAAKLYAILDAEISKQREKLEALIAELPKGDVLRGHKVFNSVKTACATCHKIGYVGGVVGPDLTRIGSIRTERDLLEAIVFPSLSFVRSYEPVSVNTANGQQFNGILKKDAPDEVILVVAADKEVRIARGDIEELKPSSVSIMPAGLDQQLTKQELADLVAFLRASK